MDISESEENGTLASDDYCSDFKDESPHLIEQVELSDLLRD